MKIVDTGTPVTGIQPEFLEDRLEQLRQLRLDSGFHGFNLIVKGFQSTLLGLPLGVQVFFLGNQINQQSADDSTSELVAGVAVGTHRKKHWKHRKLLVLV